MEPRDPERIAESTARHLLERATALDVDGPTLEQLRQAAMEAGISSAAFDAAVAEWRAATAATELAPSANWASRIARNTAGLVIGWVSVAGLAVADSIVGEPWLVHKLSDPVGLVIGAVIASRLRARAASVVLGGLAMAQAAEFLLDLSSGAPAIRGSAPHIALMIAGVGGVAIGRAVWGRSTRSNRDLQRPSGNAQVTDVCSSDAASHDVGLTDTDADKRFLEMLRLRRSAYLIGLQPG